MTRLPKMDAKGNKKTKDVIVWCDGCYDLVHFGHANSLRQAKALGQKLLVGVHSDEEITKHKGPPVFTQEERVEMLSAIKWVDQVIKDAPYVTTVATLDKYGCDFCAHGNDITTTADGHDTYQEVKDAKRYEEVERTRGVSTTDLVKRMLLHSNETCVENNGHDTILPKSNLDKNGTKVSSPWTGMSNFLPTTRKLQLFADGKAPLPGSRIVYVAGAFDVLHPGHLAFLKKAKSLGDYLYVGLYSDLVVNSYKGVNYPIMNLHERVLSILACRYVDEVVIGAPFMVTKDLIESFNVSIVAHGKVHCTENPMGELCGVDPYAEIRKLNIVQVIDSSSKLTTKGVVHRVIENRMAYIQRNAAKEKKELDIIADLYKPKNIIPSCNGVAVVEQKS